MTSTPFQEFLSGIEPTAEQRAALQEAHHDLRALLAGDDHTAGIVHDVFLQGSYRRATLVRAEPPEKADVDMVLVTALDHNDYTPSQAQAEFHEFLDREYEGWEARDRSICLPNDDVKLDMVITAAPDEVQREALRKAFANNANIENPEFASLIHKMAAVFAGDAALRAVPLDWRSHPLLIPDRHVEDWVPTNPLAQIDWTSQKNAKCNGHYTRTVKAIKWWRNQQKSLPKYPKGYPLEHMVGDCCPNGIANVEEGVTTTLEAMAKKYAPFANAGRVPALKDHGVPDHDVMARITPQDFQAFHAAVCTAAVTARRALNATDPDEAAYYWHQLFGDAFPAPTQTVPPRRAAVFKTPTKPASPTPARFA